MKATGMIRRIDDLGRIVIPKEIRKNLKIRDGESLEIFLDNNYILLKKYSPVESLIEIANRYIDAATDIFKCNIFITDNDRFVATSGSLKKNYLGQNIGSFISEVIESKKKAEGSGEFQLIDNLIVGGYYYIIPINFNGDNIGTIGSFGNEPFDDIKISILMLGGQILCKYIE